jgi:hypothetical protein
VKASIAEMNPAAAPIEHPGVGILSAQLGLVRLQWPVGAPEKPASGGLLQFREWSRDFYFDGGKSGRVSGASLKYSRFQERAAGDWV